MYPLPELNHGIPCTCSIYCTVEQNQSPCYLWIHLPKTHGRVITFDSLTDAYTYGIRYIIADSARPLKSDDDNDLDFWDLEPWAASDGTNWCIPYLSRYMNLCDWLNSVASGLMQEDSPLIFLTTEKRQLLLGLGKNLPYTSDTIHMIKNYGYTLEHCSDQTINPTIIRYSENTIDLPDILEYNGPIDYEGVD